MATRLHINDNLLFAFSHTIIDEREREGNVRQPNSFEIKLAIDTIIRPENILGISDSEKVERIFKAVHVILTSRNPKIIIEFFDHFDPIIITEISSPDEERQVFQRILTEIVRAFATDNTDIVRAALTSLTLTDVFETSAVDARTFSAAIIDNFGVEAISAVLNWKQYCEDDPHFIHTPIFTTFLMQSIGIAERDVDLAIIRSRVIDDMLTGTLQQQKIMSGWPLAMLNRSNGDKEICLATIESGIINALIENGFVEHAFNLTHKIVQKFGDDPEIQNALVGSAVVPKLRANGANAHEVAALLQRMGIYPADRVLPDR